MLWTLSSNFWQALDARYGLSRITFDKFLMLRYHWQCLGLFEHDPFQSQLQVISNWNRACHSPWCGYWQRTQSQVKKDKKQIARIQMPQNRGKITFIFKKKWFLIFQFSDPPNLEKHINMFFSLRKHRQNPKHTVIIVITCILSLPRCQKHCKYHVSQSWWSRKIATTTRSVPDPARSFSFFFCFTWSPSQFWCFFTLYMWKPSSQVIDIKWLVKPTWAIENTLVDLWI